MSISEWLDDSNGDSNSEAASEKSIKRKRGRPRVTQPYWDALESTVLSHKTRQTVVKRFLATEVDCVLTQAKGQDFGYLLDRKKAHIEIRASLGQFRDEATMLKAAAVICERKMTAKDAVLMCRQWRNGKAASGDTDVLAKRIARVIRDYKLRHPDMTDQQVRSALCHVGEDFGEQVEAINEDDQSDEPGEEEHTP
jgi:hypothetical protein